MIVALIGNQNSGKTSLFNKLTGSNQKVGNWPGVTIERKEGKMRGTDITLVDLPGVYSLSPYTREENISRDFLLQGKPDLIINVVDSTQLERNLFLTTQIMDLGIKTILALNMSDLLEKKGLVLDENKLSYNLGFPAIKISAKTGYGVDKLMDVIKDYKIQSKMNLIEKYPKIVEKEIKIIKNYKIDLNYLQIIECVCGMNDNIENVSEISHLKDVLCKIYDENLEEVFAGFRYDFIVTVRNDCLTKMNTEQSNSERLDKIFLNKWLAIPIFIFIMCLMYFLSIGVVGKYTTGLIGECFALVGQRLEIFLTKIKVSKWLSSLICDGVIAGVGSVLSFLPELVVIFICISFLETIGYMSRISFMFDRLFRRFGLSGKSLVPFIVGTGCSVPAISSTRTIEQNSEREMTIVLSPFVPCSAKLPIIALFVGYFFPNQSGLVTASLYFLSIFLILLSTILISKLFYKNNSTSFISELPEYKSPSVKYIVRDVFDKAKDFVTRAGTVILICSCFVWFLSSFSLNLRFSQNIQTSILASIGNVFSWFFYPIIGERNWAITVSAIQGLIAKEQVVSSMSIISGLSQSSVVGEIFYSEIFSFFSKPSAYAFMVFNLFSAPCIASIGAMKSELKSTKKTILAILFQIAIAWIFASISFYILSRVW